MRSSGTCAADWSLHQLLQLVASDARSNIILQLCNHYGSVKQHDQVCTDAVQFTEKCFRFRTILPVLCAIWSAQ